MAHRIAKKQIKTQIEPPQSANNNPNANNGYYEQQPSNQAKSSKLPRPQLIPTDAIYHHDKASFRKGMLAFPPPESLFLSQNNYDAGPDFLRPTSALMLGVPKKTNFPFGAWINPFGSDRVHSIRVKSPYRCGRCKAYINPYFKFNHNKTAALCNICGANSQIPTNIDPNNLNNH